MNVLDLTDDGDSPDIHREEVLRRTVALADHTRGHDVILLYENEKHIYGDTHNAVRTSWSRLDRQRCG